MAAACCEVPAHRATEHLGRVAPQSGHRFAISPKVPEFKGFISARGEHPPRREQGVRKDSLSDSAAVPSESNLSLPSA